MEKVAAHSVGLSLVFSLLCISPNTAQAKKGSPLFEKHGLGCWDKALNENVIQSICFKSGGIIESMNINKKEAEGLGTIGYYMASDTSIRIIGFPGEGWVSSLYGNVCRWNVVENPRSLFLDGPEDKCDIRGSWHRNNELIGDQAIP